MALFASFLFTISITLPQLSWLICKQHEKVTASKIMGCHQTVKKVDHPLTLSSNHEKKQNCFWCRTKSCCFKNLSVKNTDLFIQKTEYKSKCTDTLIVLAHSHFDRNSITSERAPPFYGQNLFLKNLKNPQAYYSIFII